MFRVVRCRYPFGLAARDLLLRREPGVGRLDRAIARLGCPGRLVEMLEWSHVVLAEDPRDLALAQRFHPTGRFVYVAHDVSAPHAAAVAAAVETAELTITVSDADRGELLERYGAEADRVVVVESGVDARRFSPVDPSSKEALRRELGLPDSKPIVVFVGSASQANREALPLVRELAESAEHLTFLAVGEVATPGKSGRLLSTGRVGDVAPYLAAADIGICPVEPRGGTKVALLELLASGLPTVTLAATLLGSSLEAGCHVCTAGRGRAELREALDTLAADAERRDVLGKAGRAHVVEHATWGRSADVLAAALSRLVNPSADLASVTRLRAAG
jgi:glycosyltransferase involved in cell wall biosynthesis